METPPPEDHSFAPPNHRLITVYLRRRVAGGPLPSAAAAYFHDIDIYAAEPAALTVGLQPLPARKGEGNSWLFFTPVKPKSNTDNRRSRRVGGGVGTWHSEHAPEAVVDDEGNRVGHRQLFSYKEKGGRRSGWSMWEFGAADQAGGETLLVLCKIHQAHAGSRRADGSAVRSARKRKATDGDVDTKASAPVKRRLFAPHAPTPPAASEDKIGATSQVIRGYRSEAEPSEDKIDTTPVATPSSRAETEASKDTPRNVLSFWNKPSPLPLNKASATTLRSIRSFSPGGPHASRENIINTTMECPATASFLIPQLQEAIPSSRTETEASNDAPRSVLSFWGEPYPLEQDGISAALRSLGSFSPKPNASQENVISLIGTTMESPPSFFIPEPQASQGDTANFDCGFMMDGGAPPALEYCYNGSFTDNSGGPISPLVPGAVVSDPWTGHSTLPSPCSVRHAFQGGFPTYGDLDAGASGSWTGYVTSASCSGSKAVIDAFPTYNHRGITGSAGVQYGCGVPSATIRPSAVPSQWCGAPGLWSF